MDDYGRLQKHDVLLNSSVQYSLYLSASPKISNGFPDAEEESICQYIYIYRYSSHMEGLHLAHMSSSYLSYLQELLSLTTCRT